MNPMMNMGMMNQGESGHTIFGQDRRPVLNFNPSLYRPSGRNGRYGRGQSGSDRWCHAQHDG
jgi:hypothetical protein